MKEEWRDIDGYEGFYWVSSNGKIRSRPRECTKGGVISTPIDQRGYRTVMLSRKGRTKRFQVHRLVALAFIPEIPGKPFVNHKDANKTNNDYRNLEWCTNKENLKHADDLGLMRFRGSENGQAKLCEKDACEIFIRRRNGEPASTIARAYGVCEQLIYRIGDGKNWRHATRGL